MREGLRIINENLGPEKFNDKSFTGDVYFRDEEGLQIDRSTYNKLLNIYNTAFHTVYDTIEDDVLTLEDDLWLVFINEIFHDNSSSWFSISRKYYLSTVLLDKGIVSVWSEETDITHKEKDEIFLERWEDIDHVELFENLNGGYIFRFYEIGTTEHTDLGSNRFGTTSLVASRKLLDLLNEIIECKRKNIDEDVNEYADIKTRIEELIENENFEQALAELDNFQEIYEVDDIENENTLFYHFNKTSTLIHNNQYKRALNTIDNLIDKYNRINDIHPYAYELKGEILMKTNNFLTAINCLAISEENYENDKLKIDATKLKEESYSKLKEIFLEVPYNERKLIFISDNIYATQSSEIIILKKNNLPFDVYFPVGHPHLNEVYTCHPHKKNFYLPLKNYSEELFQDRISEFSWLLQCLGAIELKISSSKSNFSDQTIKSIKEVDAKIDYKVSSAKLNYERENNENTLIDGNINIAKTQRFKPSKSPFIPTDLVWYHSDTNWQRLATQRLNGSIITHDEIISSSQSENVSNHELKQIDAELKLLLPKIGVKYNSEDEVKTSTLKKYEFVVSVEFEDRNKLLQLEENKNGELRNKLNLKNEEYNSNLEKYKEDVMFMLENDGIIDEYERKLLNRKMKKYGLTEEDVRLLESELLTSGYSDNEQNYIQELKELLEDGKITDIERKILDRYAKKFNVTVDVQKKIDAVFIN